ncbi:Ig-like domain-containing protein, partial [Aquimarina gracilis]
MKKQIQLQLIGVFLFGAIHFGAYGQVQIGSDIDGEAAGDGSGRSVSLSADGSVLAIGASFNDGNGIDSGHVRVYKRDASAPLGWTQLGSDIDGEAANDFSGDPISLSSDGSVLAIGVMFNDGNGNASGHVRVYKRDANASLGWIQVGGDIDGEAAGDLSGRSVSLSSDGSMLAIGATSNDGNGDGSGHVRVYKRNANASLGWIQLGGDIDGEAANDGSGISVSLSSDGSMLAIGATNNDGNGDFSGHVRVYKRDDNTSLGWIQLGGDIDGEAANDRSGNIVSLSADGSVLVIVSITSGGNGDFSSYSGVFKRDTNAALGWIQLGGNIDGEAAQDYTSSISLSSDGSVLAIGATGNDGNGDSSGHVRVYKRDATAPLGWIQLGSDIDGEAAGDFSGRSVSLSSDGSVLAIGATGNDGNGDRLGHVRVYHIGASGVSIEAPVQTNAMTPFEVTFTFDRGITDFNKEDIAVAHATVDNLTTINAATYTATIAPDIATCNPIAINIPAGSAFDVDSNLPNFAAQEMVVEVVDDVPPDARAKDITVALGTNGQVILNADQINAGSTDNCGVAALFIGSNQVITSEGTFDVELIVEDVNGNRSSAFAKVTVVAPITVSIDNAPSGVEDLSPFTVEIMFSEAVTGFELGDIEVANATVGALTGSGSTYTATLVPTSLCDDITIDVPAHVAESTTTGLPNQAVTQLSVGTEDTMVPTITCPADVVASTADNGTGD